MKRFSSLIIAAILGGTISVGLIKLTDKEAAFTQNTPDEERTSVQVNFDRPLVQQPVDFSSAAELTVNGVVHVTTAYEVSNGQYTYDPIREFFYGNGYQKQAPRKATSSGSGVILSSDGFIVTNNHVISNADEVRITLNNRKTYDAEVIGTDPSTDLALLKVDAEDLPYVPYGNSDEVRIGEWVLAVGNPFNLNSTVTAGIVSAKSRDINILRNSPDGMSAVESFIQTDAAVNPGNSGGALVNANGQLVGINAAIKSNTGSYTGYSFAIPVNLVRKVVDDLLEFGTVQRGFIGVSIQNVDANLAEQLGMDNDNLEGVYVAGLSADGAAESAGIKVGDIITKVEDQTVSDVPELQEKVSRYRPGDKVMVTVRNEGKERVIPVVLRNQYGSTEVVKKERVEAVSSLGAAFEKVPEEEMKKLKIDNGLKIARLGNGKLKSSGIREGFIVTKVDGKVVKEYDDVLKAIEGKKGGVLIEGVYPNGKRAYYGFGM